MSGVVIIGFGGSRISRRSERGLTTLALDAAMAALADAGLARADLDGYVGAPWATNAGAVHAEGADEISCKTFVRAFGVKTLTFWADIYRGYATDMVALGAQALIAGQCRFVLGLRALFNIESPADAPIAYGDDQFTKPHGYTIGGARLAARARRRMAQAGATRSDLYEIVALARRHAALNPGAIWNARSVSRDAYLASAMIASPHCLYDCDMPVCGAAAFVMCRDEDIPAGAASARVLGWSGFQNPHDVFARSRTRPQDVTCCQLYDGFSSMLMEWLEPLGLSRAGRAWADLREGRFNRDGGLPLNTFGGSLGEGRLHGVGHLREGYLQAAGKAGARQLARAEICLIQNGTYDGSSLVMLGAGVSP